MSGKSVGVSPEAKDEGEEENHEKKQACLEGNLSPEAVEIANHDSPGYSLFFERLS